MSEGFKSGYVAILGRPNVGKSTLLNQILSEKVAIVTPKPQTTRNRIIGVKTTEEAQIIFVDTPGIHKPRERLGQYMLREALKTLKEVDIVLLMVEPKKPSFREKEIINILSKSARKCTTMLLINKIDKIKKTELLPIIDEYSSLFAFNEIIPISALKGDGVDKVVEKIMQYLPEGPKYYPDDIVTDQLERFLVAEIIREKVMLATEDEVPYAVAVEVVQWEEKKEIIVIGANIYVEKDSQKGIIIGKRGERLKSIGSLARKEIESILNTRVYLELWVKVSKDWKDSPLKLRELGYQ